MQEQNTIAIPAGLAERLVELADEVRPYLKNGGEAETVAVANQGEWTREMVERLRRPLAAYPAAVALLDLAAENPDKTVRYPSVVDRAGIPERQVRAELGAMTKLSSRLFGRKTWPMRAWQAPGDGVMSYQMPGKIAEWWLDR
ncbi:MAG: hypothetical protein WD556_06240 [Actinomycetota bacterium]